MPLFCSDPLGRALALCALITLLLAGCDDAGSGGAVPQDGGADGMAGAGGAGGTGGMGGAGGAPFGACVPAAEALADGRACRRDDQCPCGAYCALGRCASDCRSDADCAEGAGCGPFGRCRGAADRQVVTRNPAGQGRPRILQRALARGPDQAPRLMTIVADDGPVAQMRVVADAGAEVALPIEGARPEDLEYGPEVFIDATVMEGDARSVYVRPSAAFAAGDAPLAGVSVISGTNHTSSVALVARDDFVAPPPAEPPPLAGRYEGTARLDQSGVVLNRAFYGSAPQRPVATRITAQVFPAAGGRAVIVLQDQLGLAIPDEQWIGEVVLGDEALVRLPTVSQAERSEIAGGVVDLITVPLEAPLRRAPDAADWSGHLGFSLDLLTVGMAGRDAAPRQVWSVGLRRVGDLPADLSAPPLLSDATLPADPAVVAQRPLPREAEFLSAVDAAPGCDAPSSEAPCFSDTECPEAEYCLVTRALNLCQSKCRLPPRFVDAWARDPAVRARASDACVDPRTAVPELEASEGPDRRLSLCGGNRACVLFERFAAQALAGSPFSVHTESSWFHNTSFPDIEDSVRPINLVGLMAQWASTASAGYINNRFMHTSDRDILEALGPAPSLAAFSQRNTLDTGALNAPILRAVGDALTVTRGADTPREPSVVAFGVQLGDLSQLAERPMWTLDDGRELDFALPCAFDLSGLVFPPVVAPAGGYGLTVDSALLALDTCAALSEQYECAVVSLEGQLAEADRVVFDAEAGPFGTGVRGVPAVGVSLQVIDPEFENGEVTTQLTSAATGRTLVSKVCVFPTQPTGCAQAALCDARTEGTGALAVDALDGAQAPRSGDTACAGGGAGLVLPKAQASLPRGELVAACRADLDALDEAPSEAVGDTVDARLAATGWGADAQCLNPQRFIAQLATAGAPARVLGAAQPHRADHLADRVFMRLLQGYLEAAGYVVDDAASGLALDADAAADAGGGQGLAQLEAALAASTDRWRLLMLPRIGMSLAGVSSLALAQPDYRPAGAGAGEPSHTPADGLAVTMLRLLARQAELMAQILDRQARAGAREVPESVVEALALAAPMEAFARGLIERAVSNPAALPVRWQAAAEQALNRLEGARAEVLARLGAIVRGTNPLGIEDDDLPLYFGEISEVDGINYTAISRFILGTVGSRSGVALDAVERAREAAAQARTSRRLEAMRAVDEANNEAVLAEDILAARRALGESVQDYCGVSLYDGVDPDGIAELVLTAPETPAPAGGRVDFEGCWFRGQLIECKEDAEVKAALANQAAADRALADAELVETMEANMRNALCVATLAAGRAQIGSDEPEVLQPLTFENPFTLGDDRLDAVLWAGHGPRSAWARALRVALPAACAPPGRNGTRTAAGAPALRALEAALLDPAGPYRALLPTDDRVFVPTAYDNFRFGVCPRTATAPIPVIPHGAEALNVCQTGEGPGGLFPTVRFEPGETPDDPSVMTLVCTPGGGTAPIEIEVTQADLRTDELADSAALVDARMICDALYPQQFMGVSTPRERFETTPSVCFRGDLGAKAATLRGLTGEIQEARYELADLLDAYAIEMQSCYLQQRGNEALREAEAEFAFELNTLRSAKHAADVVVIAANETKDCLATLSGAASSDPVEAKAGGGLATGACAIGAVSGALQAVSSRLDLEMGRLETAHAQNVLAIETATEEKRCFKEAELALVGQRTQELRIQLATQELESAYAGFVNEIEQAKSALARGVAGVATAARSGNQTVAADQLIGRDKARADVAMRLARRAVYLAVRAVEYEFQVSLAARGTTIRAENPDVLEDVTDELRAYVLDANVAEPEALTEVFSLKRHLLQLADRPAGGPAGEHRLSDTERFRMLLQDPRFEVYRDGEFIGREIPFVVAPLGALDLGETVGIPIVADDSCGERLWSVNVSILGDPARTFRGFAPQVNLRIRKQNTFFANWCDRDRPGFQVASVRPSKNLFREPGVSDGYTPEGLSETTLASTARVQALLDIQPGEFITDAYVDGASIALAGRLLFGDYALFIPAASMARVDDEGRAVTDGLLLGEVDDIAIRLDYLSVTR